jgi:hypothetical protein
MRRHALSPAWRARWDEVTGALLAALEDEVLDEARVAELVRARHRLVAGGPGDLDAPSAEDAEGARAWLTSALPREARLAELGAAVEARIQGALAIVRQGEGLLRRFEGASEPAAPRLLDGAL